MFKKLLGLLVLVVATCLPASAQNGTRYDSYAFATVTGGNGVVVVPGATITVCTSAGSGNPCTPTATIYSDAGLTLPISLSQVTADAGGNFGFYIAPGRYTYSLKSPNGLLTGFYNFTASPTLDSTNTWLFANSFSAALNANGGGALLGAFTGNHTISGNETRTGTNTEGKINGICVVDGVQNATLAAAVTCASSSGVIEVPMFAVPTLTGNITVPSGVILKFDGPSGIITTGFTLTVNGPIWAPNTQIFFGTGTVVLGNLVNPVNALWFPGATPDIQITNAEAAMPNGGTVDARGYGCTPYTLTQEIDVGNSSFKPITLFVPPCGTWTASMTGGTSYALKVFNKSSALGTGSGQGQPFTIQAGATSNLDTVCGVDPIGVSAYVRLDGFACGAVSGATVVNAVLNIQHLQDEAYVGHMTGSTNSTTANKVLWIHNTCCSNVIEMVNAEGFGTVGAIPCTFGNGSTDANQGDTVRSISCVHPGNGKNNLVIQQNNLQHVGNVFNGIYMEQIAGQDNTTPFVAVTDTSGAPAADTLTGLNASLDLAGSTRYVLDIASGGNVYVQSLNMGTVSTNAVNNHTTGETTQAPINSTVRCYSTDGGCYPYKVASLNFGGSSAAITATTLYTIPAGASGQYRVCFDASIVTPATTSSTLGGANGFQVLYTDQNSAAVITTPAAIPYNTTAANLALNTTQVVESGCLFVNAFNSTNIQIQMGYTSAGATAMVYDLHVKAEYLGQF